MAYRTGKYGIVWDEPTEEPETHWFRLAVGTLVLIGLISLSVSLFSRLRAGRDRGPDEQGAPPSVTAATAITNASASAATAAANPSAPVATATDRVRFTAFGDRPPKVRNLLLRLEAAERQHDLEMAVSTIESIRSLPGNPAADLDNALARRLGTLNLKRLFERHSAQWVRKLTVGRGDSAARIARENGCTVASLARLNGDVSKLAAGRELLVLNHPRFTLAVYRLSRTADLSLNGKFFKRYYLAAVADGNTGHFTKSEGAAFWSRHGITLKPDDRDELEMLLPRGTGVTIAEFK